MYVLRVYFLTLASGTTHTYVIEIAFLDAPIQPNSPLPFLLQAPYTGIVKTTRGVFEDGWVRAAIKLDQCVTNRTGCYTCPLQILRLLIDSAGGASTVIPFNRMQNEDGEGAYRTAWDTCIYESYKDTVNKGHVVLVDFHCDDATLAKSGTQGATFIRVRFSNLKPHTETWYTVGIAPSSATISTNIPDEKRRRFK